MNIHETNVYGSNITAVSCCWTNYKGYAMVVLYEIKSIYIMWCAGKSKKKVDTAMVLFKTAAQKKSGFFQFPLFLCWLINALRKNIFYHSVIAYWSPFASESSC